MIAVEEITSLEALEGLRDLWEAAQARSAPDNVFATFDWALAWWRQFGTGRRLRVLVLREGADARAILPLWEGPLFRSWAPFRKLQLVGTGLSDRLDLLLPEDPVGAVDRAFSHLLARPAEWDVLDLREMAAGSPAAEAVRTAASRRGLVCEVSLDSVSPYLPIESDWETFFNTRFGRRWRKTLRHNARRLEATENAALRIFRTPEDGPRLLARIAAMPQDGEYHGTDRQSIFASPAKRAFFEEIVERFSRRGWLHVGVVELGNELAAFQLSFLYGGKYFDYFTGFHPDHAKLSPGAVLQAHVIEDCFRSGLREVDFLRGTEPWKAVWTDTRRQNLRVRVYRPGLRRAALRLMYRARDRSGGPAAADSGAGGAAERETTSVSALRCA